MTHLINEHREYVMDMLARTEQAVQALRQTIEASEGDYPDLDIRLAISGVQIPLNEAYATLCRTEHQQ